MAMAPPAAPPVKLLTDAEPAIKVKVLTQDERMTWYRWESDIKADASLRELQCKWAHSHGVPKEAVGFDEIPAEVLETDEGLLELEERNLEVLDLSLTPTDLGWLTRAAPPDAVGKHEVLIRLRAYPIDEQYAEGAKTTPKNQTPTETPTAVAAAPAAQPPAQSAQAQAQSKRKRAAAEATTTVPSPAETAAAAGASASEASSATAAAQAAKRGRPSSEAASAAVVEEAPAKAPKEVPAKAPKVEKAEKVKKTAVASPPGDSEAQPTEDEKIVYVQDNPKRSGSGGYDRYEQYKHAKTVQKAMALGAAKGDLAYDWKKGFYKRA